MMNRERTFLDKAVQSLGGAESEFDNGRYDNCANRAYYAVVQAAIDALERAGVRPPGTLQRWGHDFVQAQFAGQLVNRRKLYASALHKTLVRNQALRQAADYRRDFVSAVQAERALRRTRQFVATVQSGRS